MSVRGECDDCGEPIVGYRENNGRVHWYHAKTNNQRCLPPHRGWARPKAKGEDI